MNTDDHGPATVILDEDFLKITLGSRERLLHLEWKGHAASDQYRHGLETGLDLVHEHDVHFWLADLRDMTAILKADEDWANTVWFPQLFDTGLEKMAIVPSSDYFNQTSVQRSFTAVNGRLTFKVAWFPSVEEARHWLFQAEAMSA